MLTTLYTKMTFASDGEDIVESTQMETSTLIIASSVSFAAINALVAWYIMTGMPNLAEWKKLTATSLTMPQLIGMLQWLGQDNEDTRKVYLYSQYFSYFSMVLIALYEVTQLMFAYLMSSTAMVDEIEGLLSVFMVYGVIGAFLISAFEDYMFIRTSLEHG